VTSGKNTQGINQELLQSQRILVEQLGVVCGNNTQGTRQE